MYTKRVLVVTSDPHVRTNLAAALRGGGYGVFEAGNAIDALERAGLDAPGLVLVDVNLSGEPDGWTLVKLLSDSPRTEDIPVVLLSDTVTEGDLRKASLLGCRGVVQDTDPAATVAAARSVLGEPRTDVAPETPPGVLRRRYGGGPISAA